MAAGTDPVESPPAKATKLTLEFTTKTYGGEFGPDNVGAVWVIDGRGKWVYTLEMWCSWINLWLLTPYNDAGGEDYSIGLFPGTYTAGSDPPADVIATATVHGDKTHKGAAWTFKDLNGKEVPDGMYKLMFQLTEQEDIGKVLEVPFMKGAPVGTVMAPNDAVFTDLKIALQ